MFVIVICKTLDLHTISGDFPVLLNRNLNFPMLTIEYI